MITMHDGGNISTQSFHLTLKPTDEEIKKMEQTNVLPSLDVFIKYKTCRVVPGTYCEQQQLVCLSVSIQKICGLKV